MLFVFLSPLSDAKNGFFGKVLDGTSPDTSNIDLRRGSVPRFYIGFAHDQLRTMEITRTLDTQFQRFDLPGAADIPTAGDVRLGTTGQMLKVHIPAAVNLDFGSVGTVQSDIPLPLIDISERPFTSPRVISPLPLICTLAAPACFA